MSQPYIHLPDALHMVTKTPAELIRKHGGRCLLRPVRVDQSEQTRNCQEAGLKETATKTERSDRGLISK